MKSKGFTLIELLAVIVILAIIALIATPIILNIIEDAKSESAERSVEMYAKAIQNTIAKSQLNSNEPITGTFTTEDGRVLEQEGKTPITVEYEGKKVICSTIKIYEDGNIYLEGCGIGTTGNYTYGEEQESTEQKACTRQNDLDNFDTVTCTIGENTEIFYVMNSYLPDVPSDKIVMMTKYNIDPTTYRQSSSAGTIAFSSTNYWSSEAIYPVDVYDKGENNLKTIVDNYVNYLNESLIEDTTGSLLTYNQVENLGCSGSGYTCSSAPTWVYSTSYWTGSAYGASLVWAVRSYGGFNYDNYVTSGGYGVRPVITISTSDIEQ